MIEKVNYSVFVPEISLAVGEVPPEIVTDYARLTVQDFCQRTNILTRERVINIWAHTKNYEFIIDKDEDIARVISVINVTHDGRGGKLNHCKYLFSKPNKITLINTPTHDEPKGLVVKYSAIPTITSCDVDKTVADRYSSEIIAGTISRLLKLSSMPWYNAQSALQNERDYEMGIKRAAVNMYFNHESPTIKVTPGRFV